MLPPPSLLAPSTISDRINDACQFAARGNPCVQAVRKLSEGKPDVQMNKHTGRMAPACCTQPGPALSLVVLPPKRVKAVPQVSPRAAALIAGQAKVPSQTCRTTEPAVNRWCALSCALKVYHCARYLKFTAYGLAAAAPVGRPCTITRNQHLLSFLGNSSSNNACGQLNDAKQ